jgi:transposase
MLMPDATTKIYLCTGHTDMRKSINGLSALAGSLVVGAAASGALFLFRGKSADKIKIIWWDGQGFCLFYKRFECGRFLWPNSNESGSIGLTRAQLSMLLEGVDWRSPRWSHAPEYTG